MKAMRKKERNQVDTKPGYFQRFAAFSLAKEDNANIKRLLAVSHVEKYRGKNSLFLGVSGDKTGQIAAITELVSANNDQLTILWQSP